jgi:hypothetical protein
MEPKISNNGFLRSLIWLIKGEILTFIVPWAKKREKNENKNVKVFMIRDRNNNSSTKQLE